MKPAPYPADTRAKGWRFELDHEQIRQSDTWALAPADVRPWLLMLWMTAWEQTPCGSMPSDDALIAARIGMPGKAFAKARETLMRGWWLAEDGRLYHDTISARVLAMLAKKDKDRARKAGWRARHAEGQPNDSAAVTQESRVTDYGQARDSARSDNTKHQAPVSIEAKASHPDESGNRRPEIPCPYAQIVALYHDLLPSLPKAKLMTAARQRGMRKLWGWVLSSTKGDGSRRATSADEALQWFSGYFGRAAENDFLMGRTPRSAEHKDWRCDIDFLMTDKGLRQVIERTQDAA